MHCQLKGWLSFCSVLWKGSQTEGLPEGETAGEKTESRGWWPWFRPRPWHGSHDGLLGVRLHQKVGLTFPGRRNMSSKLSWVSRLSCVSRPVRYQLFSIWKYWQKNIVIFDIIVMTSLFIRSLLFPAAPRFATNLSTVFDVRSWYLPLTVSGATQACFSCHEELKKIFQILEAFPQ